MNLLWLYFTLQLLICNNLVTSDDNTKRLKYQALDPKKSAELDKYLKSGQGGWVQIGDKKWFFPQTFVEQSSEFFNFEPKSTDVWVMAYPRTGSTWTQEMVWLIANDLDFETAKSQYLQTERFLFFERSIGLNKSEIEKNKAQLNQGDSKNSDVCNQLLRPAYEVLETLPSPRFIKTHIPFDLMPNLLNTGCKIIYVTRNPKDVAVSMFKMYQDINNQDYKGDFRQFWNLFRNNMIIWSPYWEHVKEAWSYRNHRNVLFLFYEEMKYNLTEVIGRVSDFLGKKYTNEQIDKLKDHLDIENFRKNPMVNGNVLRDCGFLRKDAYFIGKGENGGWKNYSTKELEQDTDEWIRENLADTDLKFPVNGK